MHDLDLARVIHADRERKLQQDQRIRALRAALDGASDAFVPPPAQGPSRFNRRPRLQLSPRRG